MASYLIPTSIDGPTLASSAAGDLLGHTALDPIEDRAMVQLAAVVRKELRQHLLSYRFRIGSTLAVVLAVLTAWVATGDLGSRLAVHRTELEQERLALGRLHVYSFLQPLARRAPEPLSVFDHGFEGRLGDEVRINVFEIPTEATGADRDNLYLSEPQDLDLTLIVQVVLGLLALLLTYDAVVGERETRNLELVLACGISRKSLLVGKFFGAFLALGLPLGAAFGLSTAVLLGGSDVTLDHGRWLRLAGLGGAYTLYLAVMLLVGFLISVFSRHAAQALVFAVLSWLVLVFLIPRLTLALPGQIALRSRDTPDLGNAISALEEERDQQLDSAWRTDALRTRPSGHSAPVVETGPHHAVLRRYGSALYYRSLAAYYSQEVAIGRLYATRIYGLIERHTEHERARRKVERLTAALSPSLLLGRIAQSLAGTSLTDHEDFLAASRAYRTELVDTLAAHRAFGSWRWFTDDPETTRSWPSLFGLAPEDVTAESFPALAQRLRSPEIQDRLKRELAGRRHDPQSRLDLTSLPVFRYAGPDPLQTMGRVMPELSLLGALGALGASMVWRGFSRPGSTLVDGPTSGTRPAKGTGR